MTTVIIKKNENGTYKGFTCMGHAGFAKSGRDIVCAAVSVLVINTINSMEKLANEDMEVVVNEKSGFIDCHLKNVLSKEGVLLIDSMILGLSGISKEYGNKYLVLKFEEV